MDTKAKQDYDHFLAVSREEIGHMLDEMEEEAIAQAAEIIWNAVDQGGRVHVSGIGKPAHMAGYVASLLSSTGTPAYFLHGTEAVHGSCGQLRENDVVIFISNSGETAEMRATVTAIQNNGCKVIGVSGNPDSWLARQSEIHLTARANREGGELGRAPRMSIIAELLVLQALSVVLQSRLHLTAEQYVRWHPGGKLGLL